MHVLEIKLQFSIEVNVSDKPLLIKPFLNVAAICERHILESDGALTLFRIVDRFMVAGATEEFPPGVILQFEVVTSFRSGNFRGRLELNLATVDPGMNVISQINVPLLFEGDDERAANTYGIVKMEVKEEGLHWIVVKLAGEEQTRIPFRVVYQKQPTVVTGG
jgi:hypothetical protein